MNEGPNIPDEKIKSERTKGERLEEALKLINSAPQVGSAEEAFNLVNNSFLQIEEHMKEPRMRVGEFQDMLSKKVNEKNVYYTWYIGHILLIGENGSVELRQKEGGFDREAFEKDPEYLNKFNVVFSKFGADNKGVL